MERLLRTRIGANLTLIAAAAVVPASVLHFLINEGQAPISAGQHLVLLGLGSSIAGVASGALMATGWRRRDTRAVIAGGAFAAMTLLLVLHGIATPGVIFGPNGVVAVAGGLSLPVGGAVLTLAALPAMRSPRHLRAVAVGIAVLLAVLGALGVLGLAFAADVPAVPGYKSTPALALLVVGMLCFGAVAARAVRTFVLTRRRSDLAVLVGVVWLGFALVPTFVIDPYTWAWWMGHALELVGIALVGIPVALDVHRGQPSRPLVGDLPAAELVAQEEAFLGPRVTVLLRRLADKDRSTEEHTRRVAAWAVAMGDAMGLAPARLRELALGGLLHDIGKLSVPTAILAKPGSLTDAEMDVIRAHPVHGDELLAELGYSDRVRAIVRGHHERLDGTGYPDRLADRQLTLETRILAVADVWDALVSPRVYRAAWSPERALGLMIRESGVAFDAACVQALRGLAAGTLPGAAEAPLADAA